MRLARSRTVSAAPPGSSLRSWMSGGTRSSSSISSSSSKLSSVSSYIRRKAASWLTVFSLLMGFILSKFCDDSSAAYGQGQHGAGPALAGELKARELHQQGKGRLGVL